MLFLIKYKLAKFWNISKYKKVHAFLIKEIEYQMK